MKAKQSPWPVPVVAALLGIGTLLGVGNDNDDVRADPVQDAPRLRAQLKDQAADFWIYDDLEAGYARARKTAKPLLISFRCVT